MLTEFNEEFISSHQDPVDGIGAHEFPFDEVFAKLDGATNDLRADECAKLGTALREILNTITAPTGTHQNRLFVVAVRTLALQWLLDPSESQNQLAAQLGLSGREALSRHVRSLSARFALSNRAQVCHRHSNHTTTEPR